MKRIIVVAVVLLLPTGLFAQSAEQEASVVCAAFVKIEKECYLKASKRVSPAQAVKSISKGGKYPDEIVQAACQQGYEAFKVAGKISKIELERGMKADYTTCYANYLQQSYQEAVMEGLKSCYDKAQAYFKFNPAATVTTEMLSSLGMKVPEGVTITILNGSKDELQISGKHANLQAAIIMDAKGEVKM